MFRSRLTAAMLAAPLALLPLGVVAPAQAMVSDTPSATTPSFDGDVRVLVHSGNKVFAGGDFTSVTDADGTYPRSGAAAFDLVTGEVLPWNPRPNGPVLDLLVAKEGVFLAGDFTQLRTKSRPHLALVRKDGTGKLKGLRHVFNSTVTSISLDRTRIYVGGDFTAVDGKPRSRLALLRRSGFALKAWAPRAAGGRVRHVAATPDGVYVSGGFDRMNGKAAYGNLALVRKSNGSLVRAFAPKLTAPVFDFEVAPKRLYLAVAGEHGGWAGAVRRDNGGQVWRRQFDGDVHTVAVLKKRVFIGGHFLVACTTENTEINGDCLDGSVTRNRLAAMKLGGALTSWDPDADSVNGVWTLRAVANREWLLAGGDFTTLRGGTVPAGRYARFAPAAYSTASVG